MFRYAGVKISLLFYLLEDPYADSFRRRLGYTWEPQIAIPITKALALYPVGMSSRPFTHQDFSLTLKKKAAISVFMMLITLIPILWDKGPRTLRVFTVFAWSSFVITFLAFVFMIAMWAVADERFKKAGWEVRWGPLVRFFLLLLIFERVLGTRALNMLFFLLALDVVCGDDVAAHRRIELMERCFILVVLGAGSDGVDSGRRSPTTGNRP